MFDRAVVTDMAGYYASIDRAMLWTCTSKIGERGEAARRLSPLAHWQRQGLVGLPIGPDTSEVYGSFALHRFDVALEEEGYESIRLMDDVLIWLDAGQSSNGALRIVDGVAARLGFERSIAKTAVMSAEEVEDYLSNTAIDYHLSGGGTIGRKTAIVMFHEALDNDPVNYSELAFSVAWFAIHHDPYPVGELVRRRHVLPLITKQAYRLIRGVTRDHQHAAYPFFELIGTEGGTDDATRYVAMVGLSNADWGRAEGAAASQYLMSARPPLRAAAIRLMSRTPELELERVVDRALRGSEMESRGASVALHGLRHRGIKTAARHIRSLRPERAIETYWASGAA